MRPTDSAAGVDPVSPARLSVTNRTLARQRGVARWGRVRREPLQTAVEPEWAMQVMSGHGWGRRPRTCGPGRVGARTRARFALGLAIPGPARLRACSSARRIRSGLTRRRALARTPRAFVATVSVEPSEERWGRMSRSCRSTGAFRWWRGCSWSRCRWSRVGDHRRRVGSRRRGPRRAHLAALPRAAAVALPGQVEGGSRDHAAGVGP
jgi:hypothetical protein